MFWWLAKIFSAHLPGAGVVSYITFRAIMASLTSLFLCLWLGPVVIRKLKQFQIGQFVRDDGPQSHLSKAGTPTMGGALILFSLSVATLLWADLSNIYIWVALIVTLGFGTIGWLDDYLKISKKNSKGLSAKSKYLWQSLVGLVAVIILYLVADKPAATQLLIPFFKNTYIDLGLFFIVLGYFVIVGTSNAVNLTDGLDGLALLPVVLVGGALGVFAYVEGNINFAEYLMFPHFPGVGEITVFCASLVGAGLGFLWYNAYPAEVFMGDVGSLGLGAALGVVAVIVGQELILFLMGGIFVAETLSVILQVGYFKLSGGKRIFRMAPLHHHFELKGWPEPKVIVRFWIITVVLVLFGLATLKLR